MRITPLIFDITVGLYTLALLAAIQYYEHKLDTLIRSNLKLKYSKNSSHYAWLQLELDKRTEENNALQIQIKSLKAENTALRNVSNPSIWSVRPVTDSAVYVAGESKDMHYESSTYKTDRFESAYEDSKYRGYSLYVGPYTEELDF